MLFIDDYARKDREMMCWIKPFAGAADVCRLLYHLKATQPTSCPSRGERRRRVKGVTRFVHACSSSEEHEEGVSWKGKHDGSLLHNQSRVCLIRKQARLKLFQQFSEYDLFFFSQYFRKNLIKSAAKYWRFKSRQRWVWWLNPSNSSSSSPRGILYNGFIYYSFGKCNQYWYSNWAHVVKIIIRSFPDVSRKQ